MDKWEYLSFRVPANMKQVQIEKGKLPVAEYLNYLGAQGWELVSSVQRPTGDFQLFFKRNKSR
jgi:hypothetical protein